MISLVYKIFGDNSPFRKTVTKDMPADAQKGGDESGKMFASQFKAGIMKYIGIGALTGVITNLVKESAAIMEGAIKESLDPETFQILTKASEQSGKSLQELRELMKEFPREYAAMSEAIRQQGGIISNQDVENLAQIERSMREIKGFFGSIVSGAWRGMKQNALNVFNFAKAAVGLAPTLTGHVLGSTASAEAYANLVDKAFGLANPFMDRFRDTTGRKFPQAPGQTFSQAVTASNLGVHSRALAAGFDIMTMLSGRTLKGSGGDDSMQDLIDQVTEMKKLIDQKM